MRGESLFSIELDIKPSDVEPVYGHVHHGHILGHLEVARCKFLEHLGCPNESFMSEGLFIVISELQVSYKREIREGPITVTCEACQVLRRSIRLKQRIINQRGKVALEASIELMFLAREQGRAVSPPQRFVNAFLSHYESGHDPSGPLDEGQESK